MLSLYPRIVHQPGLQWDDEGDPEWSNEPSIDTMKKLIRQHLNLTDEPQVTFFAEGAINKLYAFDCARGRFLMRVTLPVAPGVKTDSEIATMAFVRKETNIPVPQIVAHDSDLHNELGFEWIIMERVQAQPLQEVWHQMSWLKKHLIVQQLAAYWSELFKIRFAGIGSIQPHHSHRVRDYVLEESIRVGELIIPDYFVDGRYQLDIDRGPYNSSRTYVNAYAELLLHQASKLLASDDEDEIIHGRTMKDVYEGLKTLIPRHFLHQSSREQTQLYHRDISPMNVLVNTDGDLVSIVDWECVAAVPIWQACELPQLLQGTVHRFNEVPNPLSPVFENDANSIIFYKERVMDYELPQLRTFFLEEMQRLSPEWVAAFHANRVRHDILLAIQSCHDESFCKWISAWVKAQLAGPEPDVSLTDALRSYEHRKHAAWFQAWQKSKN